MAWQLPGRVELLVLLCAFVAASVFVALTFSPDGPPPSYHVKFEATALLSSQYSGAEDLPAAARIEDEALEPLNVEKLAAVESSRGGNKEKIAFVVVVTKDGPVLDGAGVLREAIRRSCWADYGATAEGSTRYDYEYIAITNDEAVSPAMEDGLRRLRWKVDRRPLPVPVKDIEDPIYQEMVHKAGCCGAAEFLKLYAFALLEYKRVVLLDMDSFVMGCLDPLFDDNSTILFTYDMGMCKHCGRGPDEKVPPYQGGFFVVRPSQEHFDALAGIVRQGDFREPKTKRKGVGWAGTGIGWYWGGRTIQGIFPYYFSVVRPGVSKELDPCVYNNMVDNEACQTIAAAEVRNCHFTVCQKPWKCRAARWRYDAEHQLCRELHNKWFDARAEAAISLQLVDHDDVQSWAGTRTARQLACTEKGNYVPLLEVTR